MTAQNGFASKKPNNNHQNEYLFDINLLESIFQDYSLRDSKLCRNIYDGKYIVRPLGKSDFDQGYIDLLRQLTECGTITYDDYEKRFNELKESSNTYYTLIIQDKNVDQRIVGSATLVCEKKFIRQCGTRGRIEDVVVDDRCRGQQLGKVLVDLLTQFARDKCDCYKISLECKDHLVNFYQKFGYKHEDQQNYLCRRFIT
ncbi:unnamed protein product [Rotaria magnacalcarata]|uniref:Glucosamine 6-phosphate N-acetyltransferase n=1 Tax=Rotaria magnacalcarata TaxID=392030 RepID=A0A818XX18_9BILA|nr:unnamed protein product [Rotaria magnacalcarata]CAF1667846.1 unnamed protein product [Rotaria magnacalcarata]CAF1932251.1 unnamed protein product [Rotaria magnacalcarata]CAF2056248.1 unnamed protein product [Rotaria magnacalcarata]CAF2058473.1 unnamed protein product [Rotaria magnacalcarata]